MLERRDRFVLLSNWLKNECGLSVNTITPVSGDASFRRYFRVVTTTKSYIAMDAPPEKESCCPFINITLQLETAGLHTPHIYAANLDIGFLLLADLGDALYLNHLNKDSADRLYSDAIDALLKIQAIQAVDLPPYDQALLWREMELFREWFLGKHLNINLSPSEHKVLDQTFEFLAASALRQPQRFVHRDYHSRNLIVTPHNNPGILDYQDAVRGAVTYDLLSLLRDSYIAWPEERVIAWVLEYRDKVVSAGIIGSVSDEEFIRWFDLIGVQRQLKVCGIFARLYHRDGKQAYLQNIPLTLRYLMNVCKHYPKTKDLYELLHSLDVTTTLNAWSPA